MSAAHSLTAPSRRAIALTLSLAVAALRSHAAIAAPGDCPAAIVFLQSYSPAAPFPVEAAAYDTSFLDVWTAHIAFDRASGALSLSANSSGRMSAVVRVVERFDVSGVAPGTLVPATIEFQLDGWSEQSCGGSGCGIRLEATLAAGGDSVRADADQTGPGLPGHDPLITTLSLPVVFTAGTPIEAQFSLDYGTGPGGGGASADCTAHYGVSGLPAGVHAFPCVGGDVTPVRPSTWGALKRLYR